MRTDMLLMTFDELSVGDAFETRGRTVTEADIVAFAAYTGDHHPIHTDDEWARESPFERRIAHGMLVVSYALGLVPFSPENVVALRRLRDVTFKRPVYVGDTIRVRGKLERKSPLDDERGLVTVRADVTPRAGAAYCRMRIDAIWRRAADEPSTPALAGAHDHA